MDKLLLERYHDRYLSELFNDCLPFWLNYGIDHENGGLYTALMRDGSLYTHDKSVWLNGRCLWLFSSLCSLYGEKPEWRKAADLCKSFLDNYCIDPADGRMYFTVTGDGKPLRKRRYMFSETFYIMGSAAYGKAFGDKDAIETARKYFDMVVSIYRDRSTDPSHPEPKVDPSTRSLKAFSEPMIILNVSHVMQDCDEEYREKYMKIAQEVTDDIFKYFYHEELSIVLENVRPDGSFDEDSIEGRFLNPGHSIEAVWFLLEQMERSGDKSLLPKIENIYKWATDVGWDDKNEGLIYFCDVKGYTPFSLEHDKKVWWGTCEQLIASLRLYEVTGDAKYWEWFTRVDNYATRCFRDPEFGEWFGYLNNDNSLTTPVCKGNMFKGAFHVPRMLYQVERCLSRLIEKS